MSAKAQHLFVMNTLQPRAAAQNPGRKAWRQHEMGSICQSMCSLPARQECDNFVGSKHDMKSKLVALILLAASTASAKEKWQKCGTRKRKPRKGSRSMTSSQQRTPREVCLRVLPRTLNWFWDISNWVSVPLAQHRAKKSVKNYISGKIGTAAVDSSA